MNVPMMVKGVSVMKTFLLLSCLIVMATWAQPAKAEIIFRCDAGSGTECAFSVLHADGMGATNFVLGPGQTNGLNDAFAGGRYCVVVSKPRAQIRDWPPVCVSAVDGATGKVVSNIQAGKTYN
jgi:hypothetical protein